MRCASSDTQLSKNAVLLRGSPFLQPPKSADERQAEEAAAAADADADVGAGSASSSSSPEKQRQQVQREVQVTSQSRSRQLQVELFVDEPPKSLLHGSGGGPWLSRQPLVTRTGSIRGRLRNRVGRRVSVSSPSAVQEADVISADAV